MKSLRFVLFAVLNACVASTPESSPDDGSRRRQDGVEDDGAGGGGVEGARGSDRPAGPLPFTCEDVCDDGDEHDCFHGPCAGSTCDVAPMADGSPCAAGDGVCLAGVCVTSS
jgi:hypothetical protein